ncbi:hypothetical protein BCR33DRAFT_726713 [Rhizoclosmatium globosum]|uniref:Xylanolytic transcriptional activator regulatory domain-containing protein n=1 Tax=Rhizoclosmatium globosum TaxID=329046 RepID=A0A1Y2ATF9_9FUNG|nr:hypothetical protein BCR33DRAFT_726713 [Rhizoclosmatium globosum]|eukprot:ORY25868.1 hypothetical protein BCR33DRAFT_726713 [Rhizoclosmatium globosum]
MNELNLELPLSPHNQVPDRAQIPVVTDAGFGGGQWYYSRLERATPFNVDVTSINPVLEQYLTTFDAPLSHTVNDMTLVDPDLLPTFQDWLLAFKYYTESGTTPPLSDVLDAESFLRDFFHKPAILRLVFCTLISYTEDDTVQKNYLRRTRKALYAPDLTPSVELMYAYNIAHIHARNIGELALAEQFMQTALKMLIELRMDIDPDDSPWLSHLTARQKEERRRLFWKLYIQYSYALSYLPEPFRLELTGERVKARAQVFDPNPVFSIEDPTIDLVHQYVAELQNLIGNIRESHSTPPATIKDCLSSANLPQSLHSRFLAVHQGCPIKYRLRFENPSRITTEEQTNMIALISTFHPKLNFLGLNLELESSISVLHRPILFLTSLRASRPQYINAGQQSVVLNAIQQCFSSASRVLSLSLFLEYITMGGGASLLSKAQTKHYGRPQLLNLLESFIVLWFIACRMDSQWLQLSGLDDDESLHEIKERMDYIMISTRTRKLPKPAVPMVEAMEILLSEVDDVVRNGRKSSTAQEGTVSHELGIYTSRVDSDSITEPWCYLGFLGLELGSKRDVRWKGRKEDSWRLFWKLNA